MDIRHPLPDDLREDAARLYLEAFRGKIGGILGPEARALRYLATILDPDHAIAAVSGSHLLGLAGFKTSDGGMMSSGLRALAAHFGWPGALWRAPLLMLLDRDVKAGVLQMDGICVDAAARGQGVGTALLGAIYAMARDRQCSAVTLDVIDTNPRAAALYAREGFLAVRVQHLGPLRHVFGFASATTMRRAVQPSKG